MGSSRSARCCRSPRRRTFGTRPSSADPTRRSARAQRDEVLRAIIRRIWTEHHQVYGPRKVWRQMGREGLARRALPRAPADARDGPRRRGARTGVGHHDTVAAGRPAADAISSSATSRRRARISSGWRTSRTSRPGAGFVYVAFVIDVFARRIVGWRVSASLRTDFVLGCARAGDLRPLCDDRPATWCITATAARSLGSRGRRNACAFRRA